MITRNLRLGADFPDEDPRSGLPRLVDHLPLLQIPERDGPFHVEANRALREDERGHYVWAAPSLTFLDPLPEDGVLEVRKHYVEVGDRVSVGQTLCILEAMKLMNELEAEISGTIKEIAVENAEPVEYGQVLFRILPG